jgi:hypothetical protein
MDLMDGRLHKRDRIIQTGVSSGKAKKRNQSLKKKKQKKKHSSGFRTKELDNKKWDD